MRWLAVSLLVAGCLQDHLVPCGDQLCPIGSTCVVDVCASQEQLDVCVGLADGDRCTTMASAGACDNGVCIIAVCGNGKTEAPETCDDGNLVGGDGCAEQCDSTELCGNDVVDYRLGEQCDEGIPGRSGDGCSSTCRVEIDLWREIRAAQPALNSPGVAFDSVRNRLVTFGGIILVGGSYTDQTWEWNGVAWDEIEPPTRPSARMGRLAFDRARHRVVLFGGLGHTALFDETWEYDGVTWTKRNPATIPPARYGQTMTYDEVHHVVVMFGGATDDGSALADTWTWDGTDWTPHAVGIAPAGDIGLSIAFDPAAGNVLGFGGGETWIWDGVVWTHVTPVRTPPIWYEAGLAGRSDGVIMYGGGGDQTDPGSIWWWTGGNWHRILDTGPTEYNPLITPWVGDTVAYVGPVGPTVKILQGTWTVIDPQLRKVGAGSTAAFDPVNGVAVMFGDRSGAGTVWEWDGKDWLPRKPQSASVPQDRSFASMAYDDVDGEVYMFGGNIWTGQFSLMPTNEVWSWNARTSKWTQHVEPSPLPPVGPATLVFLSAANRFLIVVGSNTGLGTPIETWDYRPGIGFTKLTPAHTPMTGELLLSVAYDPVRDRAVMIGTDGATWEWDGTDWLEITGAARLTQSPRMTYDARGKRIVGFGQFTLATYAWDGTTWTTLSPALSPPVRKSASMWFDPIRNHVVLYGGTDLVGTDLLDTWAYGFESGTPTEKCVADDTDGDGLVGCADPDCAARCTTCGNGTCGPLEDYLLCPADCPAP